MSTTVEGEPYGCIINTAFQITAQPARIAVSLNRDNYTHEKISTSGLFGLTVLAEDCAPSIIGTFGYKSGRDTQKFEGVAGGEGVHTAVPLLTGEGMTTFECKVVDQLEVGTHTLFVGEVLDGVIIDPEAREMTYRYYHEVLKGVAPKNAPTFIEELAATEPADATGDEVHICTLCKYEYHKTKGSGTIAAGTSFEDIPGDWVCPICGAGKEKFVKQ